MKRAFFYLSAVVCALSLMTSCLHEVTPDSMSGTFYGKMDVEINIPNLKVDELELPGKQATVCKVNESYVDITLDLNLAQYIDASLAALIGQNLDFGHIMARCLVGPTIDGEASLSGTATIAGKTIPVYGEYDERTLDVTLALGIVTIEFEGFRK